MEDEAARGKEPFFGCTPDRLPELLATVLKGNDLRKLAETAAVPEWKG